MCSLCVAMNGILALCVFLTGYFMISPLFIFGVYLGKFFCGLLQTLSSNLSAFPTFLATAFYQPLAVSQSLGAQINPYTNTGHTEATLLLPASIFHQIISSNDQSTLLYCFCFWILFQTLVLSYFSIITDYNYCTSSSVYPYCVVSSSLHLFMLYFSTYIRISHPLSLL